jgi:hypothetical protein
MAVHRMTGLPLASNTQASAQHCWCTAMRSQLAVAAQVDCRRRDQGLRPAMTGLHVRHTKDMPSPPPPPNAATPGVLGTGSWRDQPPVALQGWASPCVRRSATGGRACLRRAGRHMCAVSQDVPAAPQARPQPCTPASCQRPAVSAQGSTKGYLGGQVAACH